MSRGSGASEAGTIQRSWMGKRMDTISNILSKQEYCLIAEIGVNYYDIAQKEKISNMEAAKLMCRKAKEAGADAVKFQTYKANKIASKYSPAYWNTQEEPTNSQYELFQKYDSFGEKEYREISAYCKEIGIIFLSTPFDFEAADYLTPLMDYYKISSSDITNIPFIRYIAKKNKPILLSVGASTEEEIEAAVNEIKKAGSLLSILHCVLEYPTSEGHAALAKIRALKEKYPDTVIGYSDHTKPNHHYDVIKTAFIMGAQIIEKHFTLDKTLKGNDHYHAMDPEDIREIKKNLDYLKMIMGECEIVYQESEKAARLNARRSIVVANELKVGETIQEKDLTFKRPGMGIEPYHYEEVIGRCVNHDIKADTVLQWSDLV